MADVGGSERDGAAATDAPRFTAVSYLCGAFGTATTLTALWFEGFPPWWVLLVGGFGFAVASRARVEEPGDLQVSVDLQEAAIVAASLLLPVWHVWILGALGNAVGQVRRNDSTRVAIVAWSLPMTGLLPSSWVIDRLADAEVSPSWALAAALGVGVNAVITWAAVRLVLGFALERDAWRQPWRGLAMSVAFALPAGCAGLLVASAATTAWWTWAVVGVLGVCALVGVRFASDAGMRAEYSKILIQLRTLADACSDPVDFVIRSRVVLEPAIGTFSTTVDSAPLPDATVALAISPDLHLNVTPIVRSRPLRSVDSALLDDAADVLRAGLAKFAERSVLNEVAHTDHLTGLANRRVVERFADDVPRGAPWGLVVIDVNNLKAVNDTLGHAAGDLVLKSAADALRGLIRADDVAARLGGDEFVIVTKDVTAVESVVHRLSDRLTQLPAPADLHVGASIGAATAPKDGTTLDELLQRADERMYRQKREVSRPSGYVR